jgi:RNA polymerase sigma-70 factor (ECF subfamily)
LLRWRKLRLLADSEPSGPAGAPVAERLWRDVHERLTAFVAQRVDHPADVADLVQTVFLRVHQHAANVDDEERLLPWLFQVTRNAIADYYRAPARRREVPLDAVEAPVEGPSDDGATSTEALAACVRPLMERLSPIHREALALVEFDGVSQVDAAARLGISVSGMKSRVQRGRADLREALVACCEISRSATGGVVDFAPRSEASCGPVGCEPAPADVVSLRRA